MRGDPKQPDSLPAAEATDPVADELFEPEPDLVLIQLPPEGDD